MRFTFALSAVVLVPATIVAQPKPPELVLPLGHWAAIEAASISPDGTLAVTGSGDGSVVLWDVRTGEPLRRDVRHTFDVRFIGFVAGSARIISASFDNRVVVRDTVSFGLIREIKCDGLTSMTFTRDGKRIYVGQLKENDVGVFDGTTGERLQTIKAFSRGVDDSVECLAVNRDGSRLFAESRRGTWIVWDTATGKRVAERKSNGQYMIATAVFDPDGKSILIAENSGMHRWEFGRAAERPADVPTAGLPYAVFDPTGQYALCHWHSDSGIKLLNVKTSEQKDVEGLKSANAAGFSDDGTRMLIASHDTTQGFPLNIRVGIWDTKTGKSVQPFRVAMRGPQLLRLSGDRLTVAEMEGSTAEWDLAAGGAPRAARVANVWRADEEASTPDGGLTIKLSGLGIGNRVTLTAAGEAAPRRHFTVAGDSIAHMAISPDGKRLATVMLYKKLLLWNATSGAQVRQLDVPGDSPFCLAFSGDSKRIVAGMQSGRVYIWDADSGKEVRSIAAHREPVEALAVSADDKRLFSASTDGTTRIWDGASGVEVVRLVSLNDAKDWFVMTPDGHFDGSPAALKQIKVRTDGRLKLEPIENLAKDLHRPGLLAAVLKGK